MKINSINNNQTFKRVIPTKITMNSIDLHYDSDLIPSYVTTTKIPCKKWSGQETLDELSKVLNNKDSFVYTKKEQKNIRSFFKDIVKDYNGKGSAFFFKTQNCDNFLISGKEAKQIQKLQKKQDKKIEAIENYYALMPENIKIKNDTIEQTITAYQKEINSIINNNKEEINPKTKLELNLACFCPLPTEEKVGEFSYITSKNNKKTKMQVLKLYTQK